MKKYNLSEIPCRILGRNIEKAGKNNQPLALFWGASALELNVNACEVWVKISADYDVNEPWLAVEVNGFQMSRFMVQKGEPYWVCVARKLNPQKDNLISLIKDTQPMPGDLKHSLMIHEVGLNDDGVFIPLKQRPLKIEFIGDSITSGEGLAGACDEMEWIPQWFCASKTYAVQTAHALNADWSAFSQCGWGLCWGWNGNTLTQMPLHYENVCSVAYGDYQDSLGAGDKWEFGEGSDIVVLNLGTNDDTGIDQVMFKDSKGNEYKPDIEDCVDHFTFAVVDFLKLIRKHNPKAIIVWTWGMLKLNFVSEYIQKGIELYQNETDDLLVYGLKLDSMDKLERSDADKGSRGHPGPLTHKAAARKITDFLQNL